MIDEAWLFLLASQCGFDTEYWADGEWLMFEDQLTLDEPNDAHLAATVTLARWRLNQTVLELRGSGAEPSVWMDGLADALGRPRWSMSDVDLADGRALEERFTRIDPAPEDLRAALTYLRSCEWAERRVANRFSVEATPGANPRHLSITFSFQF